MLAHYVPNTFNEKLVSNGGGPALNVGMIDGLVAPTVIIRRTLDDA